MAAVLAIAAVALFGLAVEGCLLPPGGCKAAVCNSYADMKVPGAGLSGTGWSTEAPWVSPYDKLAYIRTSFNKKLKIGGVSGNGPSQLTPSTWLGLLDLYDAPYKGDKVPALNFEWFQINGATTYAGPNMTVTTGGIPACCNACAAMEKCYMYFFQPPTYTGGASVTSGVCSFISGGASLKDGPYKWDTPTTRGSSSDGSPTPLGSASSPVFTNSAGAIFVAGFLGGGCNGKPGVVNDPHFTGAHGTRFDFNGELNKAFCLVTDKRMHLNVVLKGYKAESVAGTTESADAHPIRSWIKEVGLVWTDGQQQKHTLHLVARAGKETVRGAGFLASASFDGQAIEIPQEAGASFKAADLTLSFIGTTKKGWYDLDQFRVVLTGQIDMGLSMRVAHPKLQTPTDAEVHFNLMFNDVKVTPSVHGVLGQTYRNTQSQITKAVKYSELNRLLGTPVKADGTSGAGFLEGEVVDYEASDVLKADCKMSTFAA